jgi:NAD dependent epimerase/dehydratase family enzyme
MADALVLSSQRMLSTKLQESGFEFEHPELDAALRWAIAN